MVQWVKDLASSLQRLLRCGFGPGPGDFHMPWVSQKNQKKKKKQKKNPTPWWKNLLQNVSGYSIVHNYAFVGYYTVPNTVL